MGHVAAPEPSIWGGGAVSKAAGCVVVLEPSRMVEQDQEPWETRLYRSHVAAPEPSRAGR
jgi:hypothetical protein